MHEHAVFSFTFYWETTASVLYFVKYRLLAAIIKTNLLNCANVSCTQILSPNNSVLLLTIAILKVRLSPEETTASSVAMHQCSNKGFVAYQSRICVQLEAVEL